MELNKPHKKTIQYTMVQEKLTDKEIEAIQNKCVHNTVDKIGIRWGGYTHYCKECRKVFINPVYVDGKTICSTENKK